MANRWRRWGRNGRGELTDGARLLREWLILELLGHGGLIVLRQLCGTWWSWQSGGPFARLDVSRAMLLGDCCWVLVVVCASAVRLRLLAEWGGRLGRRPGFGPLAWLPWLLPGCALGWVVLIQGDSGAGYILGLRWGRIFEGYHILFFGYVAARIAAAALQLGIAGRFIAGRARRAWRADGPQPFLPVGVAAVCALAFACALVYLRIYQGGGSFQADLRWFARSG